MPISPSHNNGYRKAYLKRYPEVLTSISHTRCRSSDFCWCFQKTPGRLLGSGDANTFRTTRQGMSDQHAVHLKMLKTIWKCCNRDFLLLRSTRFWKIINVFHYYHSINILKYSFSGSLFLHHQHSSQHGVFYSSSHYSTFSSKYLLHSPRLFNKKVRHSIRTFLQLIQRYIVVPIST